jgi:putative PIN family toxin of toxin-antitoxin system
VRVVFDSNILISALMFPGKQAEKAISRIIENRDQLFISKAIIDEVLEVLARKFARDPEELAVWQYCSTSWQK